MREESQPGAVGKAEVRDVVLWRDAEFRQRMLERHGFARVDKAWNPDIDMASTIYTFGEAVSVAELPNVVRRHMDVMAKEHGREADGIDLSQTAGFDRFYWMGELEQGVEELLAFQVGAYAQIVRETAELNGWKLEDLNQIYLTSSTFLSPFIQMYVQEALGLAEHVQIHVVSAACNSTGMAWHEAVSRHEGGSNRTVFAALETMTPYRRPLGNYNGTTNWTSTGFFSDGGGGFAVDLARVEEVLCVTAEEPDKVPYLPAIQTVSLDEWGVVPREVGSIVHEGENGQGRVIIAKMPEPPDGQAIWMDPKTGAFFMRIGGELIDAFGVEMENKGEDWLDVAAMICHQPSVAVGQGLWKHKRKKGTLPSIGAPDRLSFWVPDYGNAPCVTFMHTMTEVVEGVDPGDSFVALFFGAGATGQMAKYRIG